MNSGHPDCPHRCFYINFGEHLQNSWNVNLLYPDAPNQWSDADWTSFLTMIKAFGFTCFEYWIAPTLFDHGALRHEPLYAGFASALRRVTDLAHGLGLQTKYILAPNVLGPRWFHACPNDPQQKKWIVDLWRHWIEQLPATDIVSIFPGDVGGCNRNGCTHETFIDLCLELTDIMRSVNPTVCTEINTWGTPFAGWGSDLRSVPDWDGSYEMITDPKYATPGSDNYEFNGKPDRAKAAMDYLLKRLPAFPAETMVAINLGFSPLGDADRGGDARPYAREIAKIRRITSWDYYLCEGELVTYPHWRLPRIAARRREERSAAPYHGGTCYTMTPKLNLLTFYAAGQLFINPDADPDQISREFCANVFGPEHAILGELFEAFEISAALGMGFSARRHWSKQVLRQKYAEMIEHLEAADVSGCSLPLFPDPETYRQDLLWFARKFMEMAGPNPDRLRIEKEYWAKSVAIYDHIPMSVDQRAHTAAKNFSMVLAQAEP
ncbi:MAG: hypothetical protein HQ523_08900 [Lentisphaerae bacterium]|nr:hypothetical protein [Lentisphaerota bacterium]